MNKYFNKKVVLLLKVVFMVGFCAYLLNFHAQVPRVLVVHSYGNDYEWVQQLNEGMNRVFGGKTHFTVHWQYMNTKNHPSFGYKQKMGLMVRRLINHLQPTIIIAVDDDAQDFVAKFYVDHPDISIIFCGVNGDLRNYDYDQAKNITGILERLPLAAVKDIIPLIVSSNSQKQTLKIINLGDLSRTVKFDEETILKYDWAPLNLIDSILVGTFGEWKKAVFDSNRRADCLYITNYRQLEDSPGSGKYVSPAEVIRWTEENATIPVLGGNSFIVDDGGSLAIAASAYEQGETAAKYALRILEGELASAIPVTSTTQFLVTMRGSHKDYFKHLPAVYEAFARGLGKFYEQKKQPLDIVKEVNR